MIDAANIHPGVLTPSIYRDIFPLQSNLARRLLRAHRAQASAPTTIDCARAR